MISFHDIKKNGFVDMWDLGPQRPIPPEPPEEPKPGKSAADNILAKLEHEDRLRDYEVALRSYGRLKAEFDHWRQNVGGPRKIEMWPINAREVLEAQAEGRHPHHRYAKHLPPGIRPGRAQIEADAREQDAAEARQRDLDLDPHFGVEATEQRMAARVSR
jgi:hypothetical protein